MNKSIDLNRRFGLQDRVVFVEDSAGLISIQINTPECESRIMLQGAQVLTWTPKNEQPVVWLSPEATYKPQKSARGGVPICWPWFGPHAQHSQYPAHGVARTATWQINSVQQLTDGRVQLGFSLPQTVETGAFWPYDSPLRYTVTLGESLELELITRNETNSEITIGEALHTYFAVSDVRNVRVNGLDGCDYLDKVDGGKRKQQSGSVTIAGEVDRVYLNTEAECVIEDDAWKRRIHIQKQGSLSSVVWNPWIEKSTKMGDLGEDGYLRMLCVESANAADNVVTVASGGEHRLWVKYYVSH